ncbi:Oidioi.mRNA.OKI2018_I69.PAR.g12025.t1.cds [Oikopleura dioica]|uniref:Oidioi.mRNA.OKI2018_I69.PAR.g12025.t1.cds n=1 Tax=Oikopleura dioica TaxID=34765 RepID=A0ABN7S4N5_OIKDI|nr:Oidioi.mRNA.OKI2018_I69.PAR.g12025.t1.cds [Oikopleura dioica]
MSDAEGFIDDGFEGVKSNQIDDEFVYNELEDVPSNLTMVDLDDSFEDVDMVEGLSKSVRFASPQVSETALGYISLILADGGCEINVKNIDALLQSVGLIVENEIIDAFAESTKDLDVNLLVESMSSSRATASANENSDEKSSPEVQKEQKTNEASEEDSDLDGCFGLFD